MDTPARTVSNPMASVDVVRVLVRQWKPIALWVVAVTVLAAAASLTLPKTYRAEACLLINPSPYKSSSLEQSPLDPDIYEKMLRMPALIEEVRAVLRLDGMTVEDLLKKLRVQPTKRTTLRETTYAPMLLLQVEDKSPQQCEAIANTWANLATSASLRIKGAVLKQSNERIRKQFEDTSGVLTAKEEALKKFDISTQLIERKAELEIFRTQLSTEQDDLESLRLDFSVAQTRLEDLKGKYRSFFVNGVWVGTLHEAGMGTSVSLRSAKVEALPLQFLDARNDLIEKAQKLTNYKIKERVDVTRRQYDILIDKILRFEQDIEDMRLSLATQKAKLQALEADAKTVPQHLIVSKAITDEALWTMAATRPRSLDELTSKRLTSEETNPIWLSMQGRIQYLKPEIASLESRIQEHERLLKQLREEQERLDKVVVQQTQDAENLESEMQFAKDRYETLFQVYLRISHDIMHQESEVARSRQEIGNGDKQVARLTSATMSLVNYTVVKDLERERLHRELASVKNIYTSLATRFEEARITELEISGDLQIAFRAVKPEDKIKPRRSLIVASAFLCALAFFSLLAIAREHMRQQAA